MTREGNGQNSEQWSGFLDKLLELTIIGAGVSLFLRSGLGVPLDSGVGA